MKTLNRARKEKVWKRDGVRCRYCGQQLRIPPRRVSTDDDRDATIDHIVAVSKGGDHRLGNLITACRPCNIRKGSSDALDFRLSISTPASTAPASGNTSRVTEADARREGLQL